MMCEAPTWCSRRLIVTEHGIPYQARVSGGRSHRSSRRSHDLPRRLGKPVVGPRVTGEPLEPDAATRDAERPKGEKRKLASRLPGNSYGRFARCADGKGPPKRYLASRLSYLDHPFHKNMNGLPMRRVIHSHSPRWADNKPLKVVYCEQNIGS